MRWLDTGGHGSPGDVRGEAIVVAWVALSTCRPAAAAEGAGPAEGCVEALARVAGGLAAGETGGAVPLFARCPDLPEAALVAGALAIVVGRFDVAAPALRRAEQEPALAARANHLAGLWALAVKDPVAARKNLRVALEADPDLAAARVARIVVAARHGTPAEALHEARLLAERPGAVRCLPDLELLVLDGLVAEALDRATRRLAPRCAACWQTIADLVARQAGRRTGAAANALWERAAAALGRVLEITPGDHEARLALGRALSALRRPGQAAEVYREGIRHDPRRARWRLLAGRELLAAGQPAEALPLVERAAGEGEAGAWSLVGRARHGLGRTGARQALERALAVERGRARAEDLLALGQVLLAEGDARAARTRLEEAAALDPDRRATHYGLSSALRALGDRAGADRVLARYRVRLEADQGRIAAEERLGHRRAAVVEALRLLSEGRPDAARARLEPWQDAAPTPLLALARAGVIAAGGGDPAPLLPGLALAALRANPWVP